MSVPPPDVDHRAILDGMTVEPAGRIRLTPAASRELLKVVQHEHDCGRCGDDEEMCGYFRGRLAESAAYLDH